MRRITVILLVVVSLLMLIILVGCGKPPAPADQNKINEILKGEMSLSITIDGAAARIQLDQSGRGRPDDQVNLDVQNQCTFHVSYPLRKDKEDEFAMRLIAPAGGKVTITIYDDYDPKHRVLAKESFTMDNDGWRSVAVSALTVKHKVTINL